LLFIATWNVQRKIHVILWGKLTFTILISTSDYTSKHSVHYRENQRRLACCTFFLEFCISRMRKENQSICFSSFLKLCLLTCVTGYVSHAMLQWTNSTIVLYSCLFILTISRSAILFSFFSVAVKNRLCPSSFQAIPPLRDKQTLSTKVAVWIYGKLFASPVVTFAQGWIIYGPAKWYTVDKMVIEFW